MSTKQKNKANGPGLNASGVSKNKTSKTPAGFAAAISAGLPAVFVGKNRIDVFNTNGRPLPSDLMLAAAKAYCARNSGVSLTHAIAAIFNRSLNGGLN